MVPFRWSEIHAAGPDQRCGLSTRPLLVLCNCSNLRSLIFPPQLSRIQGRSGSTLCRYTELTCCILTLAASCPSCCGVQAGCASALFTQADSSSTMQLSE